MVTFSWRDEVDTAVVDETILMPDSVSSYANVTFTHDRDFGYSWESSTRRMGILVVPMRTSTEVQFFSTLKGAKRNFKKFIERVAE